ncbi:PIG-L deacetylase family protein [Methanococcus voltae]|uniref:LmbE family protein n=1 Tax=Methanococcus voltae (strain ATCC BAA-1334 / A3) TaxID=456320 RepID=D7DRZ4_METV3|nr:PIG-L family deacetylase [Methanococcus voltae]MCS3901429.1 LmbE family N-acetylglucosaminyl deacetylase [Methanococcus voltae]
MNVLFLSPHTDDVELGAGGTLLKFLEKGYNVKWMVFSTSEDSVPEGQPKDMLQNEFEDVAKSIGLKESQYVINHFKVRRLNEHRQEVLDELIKMRKDFNPDLIVGPSLNDHHQDHQVVANEMIRAFKTTASIISYELPWNHVKFNTQLFVGLTENQVNQKIELLKNYKSQLILNRSYFADEFIKGWARTRGIQTKYDYAEAFEVVRWMI